MIVNFKRFFIFNIGFLNGNVVCFLATVLWFQFSKTYVARYRKPSRPRAKSSPRLGLDLSGQKLLEIKKMNKKAPGQNGNGAEEALQVLCKCNGGGKSSGAVSILCRSPAFPSVHKASAG
jgi:hypothetical protein